MSNGLKFTVVGLMESTNLGDQLIYDCLKHELNKNGINCQSLDFSGKLPNHSKTTNRTANQKIKLLNVNKNGNYRCLISFLTWSRKKHLVIKNIWKDQLTHSDIIVIGGGQLITNGSLARLFWISRTASRLAKPVYIIGVGVDHNLSLVARLLLSQVIKIAKQITVRTENDRIYLSKLFPGIDCSVVPDPALLVSDIYPLQDQQKYGVGINLQNYQDLKGFFHMKNWTEIDVMRYFLQIGTLFADQGKDVFYYTNGEAEDIAFKNTFVSYCNSQHEKRFRFLNDPVNPSDLVTAIGTREVNVCCRMHSAITSYSYGVPFKIIPWNQKIVDQLDTLGNLEDTLATGDLMRDSNIKLAFGTDTAPRFGIHLSSFIANLRATITSQVIDDPK